MKNLFQKLILLTLLTVLGRNVAAQEITDESFVTDSIAMKLYTDSLAGYYSTAFNCSLPEMGQYVVNYETESVAYLTLENLSTQSIRVVLGEQSINYPVESNTLLLRGLQKDKVYSVYVNNSCNIEMFLGYIETTKTNDKIEVPEAIYRKISAQSYGENEAKVYDIIEGITEFNFWQKLSILQSFYLKGASLPDDLKGNMPKREVFERGNNCKCGLFMSIGQNSQPTTSDAGGIYTSAVVGPLSTSFGRRGKRLN